MEEEERVKERQAEQECAAANGGAPGAFASASLMGGGVDPMTGAPLPPQGMPAAAVGVLRHCFEHRERSPEDYLAASYWLLREDFFRPLR